MKNTRTRQQQCRYWDDQIPTIWRLVTIEGYRIKDLVKHYDSKTNTILSMLNRREISLVRWRYDFAKGLPLSWSRRNTTDVESFVYKKELGKVQHELEKEVRSKGKRIAELEKEASNTNGLWVTSNELQAWKLEQQAKGVEDFANLTLFPSMGDGVSAEYCKGFEKALSIALSQAKALKEQEDE